MSQRCDRLLRKSYLFASPAMYHCRAAKAKDGVERTDNEFGKSRGEVVVRVAQVEPPDLQISLATVVLETNHNYQMKHCQPESPNNRSLAAV